MASSEEYHFQLDYLGSSMLSKATTGLGVIQKPVKELYCNFRKAGNAARTQERHLKIRLDGIVMSYSDNHGQKQIFYNMTSIHYCDAVRFVPIRSPDKKIRAAFIPLDDSKNVNTDKLFFTLDKKYQNMAHLPHPPLVACVMRRTTGVKALDCHVFVMHTPDEALRVVDVFEKMQRKFKESEYTGVFKPVDDSASDISSHAYHGRSDKSITGGDDRSDYNEGRRLEQQHNMYSEHLRAQDQSARTRYDFEQPSPQHSKSFDNSWVYPEDETEIHSRKVYDPHANRYNISQDRRVLSLDNRVRGASQSQLNYTEENRQNFKEGQDKQSQLRVRGFSYGAVPASASNDIKRQSHTRNDDHVFYAGSSNRPTSEDVERRTPSPSRNMKESPRQSSMFSGARTSTNLDRSPTRNSLSESPQTSKYPARHPSPKGYAPRDRPLSPGPRPTSPVPRAMSPVRHRPTSPIGRPTSPRPTESSHVNLNDSRNSDSFGPVGGFSASNLESRQEMEKQNMTEQTEESRARPVAKVPPHLVAGVKVLPTGALGELKKKHLNPVPKSPDKQPSIPPPSYPFKKQDGHAIVNGRYEKPYYSDTEPRKSQHLDQRDIGYDRSDNTVTRISIEYPDNLNSNFRQEPDRNEGERSNDRNTSDQDHVSRFRVQSNNKQSYTYDRDANIGPNRIDGKVERNYHNRYSVPQGSSTGNNWSSDNRSSWQQNNMSQSSYGITSHNNSQDHNDLIGEKERRKKEAEIANMFSRSNLDDSQPFSFESSLGYFP